MKEIIGESGGSHTKDIREREGLGERGRQSKRETYTERHTEIDIQRETYRDRHTERDIRRDIRRETYRERHTETHSVRDIHR